MMTQELDRETERYLADILKQQKITTDELIRQLIRDRWLMLQQVPAPNELNTGLNTELNTGLESKLEMAAPRPKNQKQMIADFVRRKYQCSVQRSV